MIIIDYGVGNLRNVQKRIQSLGVNADISNSIENIKNASSYVLPGVGAFSNAMQKLKKLDLINVIRDNVLGEKKPILGICLGMQLLGKMSEEDGEHEGINILDFKVKKLKVKQNQRLPHIGWNEIHINKKTLLLDGIPDKANFYFVHSYYVNCNDNSIIAAQCNYGQDFTAVIEKDNIYATQFHPEKSQAYGAKVINNFIQITK